MPKGKVKPELQNKIIPIITHGEEPVSTFQPKPGEYHVVRLDMNGQEIPNSDFSIASNTFKKTYEPLTTGDNPTFKVKKNPK